MISGSLMLVSCGLMPFGKGKDSDQTSALVINAVYPSAMTYRAKYGKDYEIDGNVIAKYPHFNLILFSHRTLPNKGGTIFTYEATSKDGYSKKHITCDPRDLDKKHFQLEGLHFFFHSNSQGSINIYMPAQLMAKYEPQI